MTGSGKDNFETLRVCGAAEPNVGGIVAAIDAARAFADRLGMEDPFKSRLVIVVEEVLTNIANHGRPPPDTVIEYSFERAGDGVLIGFSDCGVAFDPRDLPPRQPTPAARRGDEGGWGWPIIRQWCELVSYRHESECNRLVLLLRLTNS